VSLKNIARELRRKQTDDEKVLWRALRGRRFAGFKFRRQHSVGDYILDFYCADAKLAVELDGSQHGHPDGRLSDVEREKFLAEKGIATLRFLESAMAREPRRLPVGNMECRPAKVRLRTRDEKCGGAKICSAGFEAD
jgi:very-short-patch-repair endonuclease